MSAVNSHQNGAGQPRLDNFDQLDGLLSTVLTAEEVRAILKNREEPPELFVEAARVVVGSYCRSPRQLGGTEALELHAVFGDARARARCAAEGLASPALALAAARHTPVPEEELIPFFAEADFSEAFLEGLAGGARGGAMEPAQAKALCRLLAARASALCRRGEGGGAAFAVRLLEGLLPAEGVAGGDDLLADVLAAMYPAVSDDLLDRYLGSAEGGALSAVAPYASLASVYTRARARAFFEAELDEADSYLGANPALDDDLAEAVYTRYAGRVARLPGGHGFPEQRPVVLAELTGAEIAGRKLAYRAAFVAELVRDKNREALRGVASRMIDDGREAELGDDALRLASEAVLARPKKVADMYDGWIAALAYRRLGDGYAAAFVGLAKHLVTLELVREWKAAPARDALFESLLAYGNKEVRGELLPHVGALMIASEEERRFYREAVIPAFMRDRSEAVVAGARGLEKKFMDGDVPRWHRGLVNRDRLLGAYIEHSKTLPAHHFDFILEEQGVTFSVLHDLARKPGFKLPQYRRFALARREWMSASAISSVPDHLEGAREWLRPLRASHSRAAEALAGRADWDERDRRFFLNHADSSVRSALANQSPDLTVGEVLALLGDPVTSVRQALPANPEWRRYLALLRRGLAETAAAA